MYVPMLFINVRMYVNINRLLVCIHLSVSVCMYVCVAQLYLQMSSIYTYMYMNVCVALILADMSVSACMYNYV